jgi:hypothetical protein
MGLHERVHDIWVLFSRPLSGMQAVVGFCAGLVSVGGVILPFAGVLRASPGYGEVVTIVQDVRSRKPVAEATIEILTPQDALVTTILLPEEGRVRRSLKEGPYRIRVSHPRFTTEARQIQVQAGQTTELRVAMGPRRMPPAAPPAARAPEPARKPEAAVRAPEAPAKAPETAKAQEAAKAPPDGLDALVRFFRDLGR